MVKEGSDQKAKNIRKSYVPFIVAFALMAFLTYKVAFPLFRPLAWSALLAFFAYPVYRWLHHVLLRGKHKNVAAAITTALIVLLLVVPAGFLGTILAKEGIKIYGQIVDLLSRSSVTDFDALPERLSQWFAARGILLNEHLSFIGDIVKQSGRFLATQIASFSRGLLGNAFRMIYQLIAITVATFFFLRDGHVVLDFIKDILPLSEEEKISFFERAKRLLQAVIYGIIFTAGIQATLGALGWWKAGLEAPIIFGAIMFVLAMIPFVGTPMVLLPGAVYLAATGNLKAAIYLAIWAVAVVSTVDNFIRPIFISEGSNIHILIVFVGVVGGLAAWGFIGLFLGPLIISLFIFFLDSYRKLWKVPFSVPKRLPKK